MAVLDLVKKINACKREVLVLGDGVPVYREKLEQILEVTHHFAPSFMNRQRGAVVAELGAKYYAEGKIENAREHLPNYLRKSQAEREREAKLHANT